MGALHNWWNLPEHRELQPKKTRPSLCPDFASSPFAVAWSWSAHTVSVAVPRLMSVWLKDECKPCLTTPLSLWNRPASALSASLYALLLCTFLIVCSSPPSCWGALEFVALRCVQRDMRLPFAWRYSVYPPHKGVFLSAPPWWSMTVRHRCCQKWPVEAILSTLSSSGTSGFWEDRQWYLAIPGNVPWTNLKRYMDKNVRKIASVRMCECEWQRCPHCDLKTWDFGIVGSIFWSRQEETQFHKNMQSKNQKYFVWLLKVTVRAG